MTFISLHGSDQWCIEPKDSPRRYKYTQRGIWRSGLPATPTCCVTLGITSVLAAARLHSEGFALEDPGCPFQLPHLATHWAQRRCLPLITCTLLHRSVNVLLSLWLTWKTPSCFLDSASSLLTLDSFFLKKKKKFFFTLDPFFDTFPASCPFLWPCCVTCGILVPWPGIEPVPPAVEAQSLNYLTTREILLSLLLSSLPHPPLLTNTSLPADILTFPLAFFLSGCEHLSLTFRWVPSVEWWGMSPESCPWTAGPE